MRLDKFLKTTRIIKRRTIAQELCEGEKVLVNKVSKKSSYEIKKGDIIEVYYYNNFIKIEVLDTPIKDLKKEEIENYIKII